MVDMADDELLDAVGVNREEFILHVHQGRDLGIFSTQGLSEEGLRE